jgi:glucose-6-phosphate 1-dehydrogenase
VSDRLVSTFPCSEPTFCYLRGGIKENVYAKHIQDDGKLKDGNLEIVADIRVNLDTWTLSGIPFVVNVKHARKKGKVTSRT